MVKREDAENSMFLREQLESVTKDVYIKYPLGKYASIVPVDTSDDEGAEEVGYLQYDSIGVAEVMANGAMDSPSVDAFTTKILQPVKDIGAHFTWTNKEVRNAAFAAKNGAKRTQLDATKAAIAATTHEQRHDDICMLGDGTKDRRFGGCYGVVFHPNVSKVEAADAWADLSNDEILEEFAKLEAKVLTDTKEILVPDTFSLPRSLVSELKGRIITGTSRNLWNIIQETYPNYSFEFHYLLNDVKKNPATGVVGANRVMLCYKKDKSVLSYKMPMAFRTEMPISTGLSWKVETVSSTAGVEVIQPLAVIVYYGF